MKIYGNFQSRKVHPQYELRLLGMLPNSPPLLGEDEGGVS